MLNKITRWIISILAGLFGGIGLGASMVWGAAGISGAKIDTSFSPLWLDYILLYGGLLVFVLFLLFLIYKCILGIIKTARKIFRNSQPVASKRWV